MIDSRICADVGEMIDSSYRGMFPVTCLECGEMAVLRRNDSFVCKCGRKYKLRVIAVESIEANAERN